MKKIKVLQVIGTLHIGGAETVAMNLYRYIDRGKFEFHYLVYTLDKGEYEEEVLRLGGKVIHLARNGRHRITYKKEILNIMKKNKYDIVHSHLLFHNAVIMKLAYKAGIKNRISHSHSTKNKEANSIFEKFVQKIYQNIARGQICRFANYFFACGIKAGSFLYGVEWFRKFGKVINNGVNTSLFTYNPELRKRIRERYALQDKCVYGNAAHFIPLKNHEFLLEVFKNIKVKQKDAYLILMGDGELRKSIEETVHNLKLNDCVLFTGNISNVNEMLQALDVFILPSIYEGLPVSLVECQAAGLHCVVSDAVSWEANICNLIKFVSLKKNAQYWAEQCIQNSKYHRQSSTETLKIAGYDIRENIYKVEKWYKRMVEI